MSLVPYYGEFLVSPIPLELSLDFCSTNCTYCFANLNRPNRVGDAVTVSNLLANYKERICLEAILLQMGFPVLLSNKVDPFSTSNVRKMLPLMRTMTETGIPMAFQTKGAKNEAAIDEALEWLAPACWYLSIAMDEAHRKDIEPGAPPIEQRFDLIRKLKSKGHRVTVGINPYVPEWLPEPAWLLENIKQAGAEGVWLEKLHLNARQVERMHPKAKAAIGETVIARACKRGEDKETIRQLLRLRKQVVEAGLEPFSGDNWLPSNYWDPYFATYDTLFSISQEFINFCWEYFDDRAVIAFDTFNEIMGANLPDFGDEKLNLIGYIASQNKKFTTKKNIPYRLSYEELLAVLWSEPELALSPFQYRCFAYAGTREGDEWVQYLDDNGMPYLVFTRDRKGFDESFFDVDRDLPPVTDEELDELAAITKSALDELPYDDDDEPDGGPGPTATPAT